METRRALPRIMVPLTQLPTTQLHWLKWKNPHIPLLTSTGTKGCGQQDAFLTSGGNVKPLPSFDQFRTLHGQTIAVCNQQSAMSDLSAVWQHAGIFTGVQAGVWKETNSLLLNSSFKAAAYPMLLLHSDCKTNRPNKGQPEGRGQHPWPPLPPQRAIAGSGAGAGCWCWPRRHCWWVRWQSPAGRAR